MYSPDLRLTVALAILTMSSRYIKPATKPQQVTSKIERFHSDVNMKLT